MHSILRLTGAVALLSGIATSANASTLYTQGYDGTANLWSSQNDTTGGNGNYATVYDDFTLAADSTITGVNFTGGFFNPSTVAPISGFTVSFYADNAGQPGGTLIGSFIAGNGSQTCVDNICTYNVGTNFAASAGTQYWMSIVADLPFPPQWGWAQGTGGDGQSVQDFFGNRTVLTSDVAFTLSGVTTAVPEPSTWAMLILGMGVVGGTMRSARRRPRTTFGYA